MKPPGETGAFFVVHHFTVVIPGCATWRRPRNPYSRSWLWISGSLASLSPRNDGESDCAPLSAHPKPRSHSDVTPRNVATALAERHLWAQRFTQRLLRSWFDENGSRGSGADCCCVLWSARPI